MKAQSTVMLLFLTLIVLGACRSLAQSAKLEVQPQGTKQQAMVDREGGDRHFSAVLPETGDYEISVVCSHGGTTYRIRIKTDKK